MKKLKKQQYVLTLDPSVVLAADLVAVNLGLPSLSSMVQSLLAGTVARYRSALEKPNETKWAANFEALMGYPQDAAPRWPR